MRIVALALSLAACMPDFDEIHLAECLDECVDHADACYKVAEVTCLESHCDPRPFVSCEKQLVRCEADCYREVQEVLGE